MLKVSDNDLEVIIWMHRTVIDPTGNKIGTVTDVHVDDSTHRPAWLAVSTGLFGMMVRLVPTAAARRHGDHVMVAYDKDTITEAPRGDVNGKLWVEEEQALCAYYGQAPGGWVAWRRLG